MGTGVQSEGVVSPQSLPIPMSRFTSRLPSALLPAVDLSAMPGGATPLLDDAFMQEVSWEDCPCASWLQPARSYTACGLGRTYPPSVTEQAEVEMPTLPAALSLCRCSSATQWHSTCHSMRSTATTAGTAGRAGT